MLEIKRARHGDAARHSAVVGKRILDSLECLVRDFGRMEVKLDATLNAA